MTAPEVRKHEGGLRVQRVTGPEMRTHVSHTVELPRCCPVSGNPHPGSTLRLSYIPDGWVVEVYSLPQVLQRFVGGWQGTDRYPAERNMEGMIRTLAQMVADALGVRARVRASLILDAGNEVLRVSAEPQT